MTDTTKKYSYDWTLRDASFTKDKGSVFSCFACGGGSTMGYKLAGFDVIGCNEIDPRMMECYVRNHKPRHSFLEPIQTFKLRDDLPVELYELDILDGSPPCSSFSLAGSREEAWGKEKKFREGQAEQVLDTLFFDFIDLADKLRPKVVIAENVKGLLLGEAIGYVRRIYEAFDRAGYHVQHWLFSATQMSVPQRRERVFFVALRKDLADPFMVQKDMFTFVPRLSLEFSGRDITYSEIRSETGSQKGITDYIRERMAVRTREDKSIGDINMRVHGKLSMFNNMILYDDEVMPTITSGATFYRDCDVTTPSDLDLIRGGSFPSDYDFGRESAQYVVGMSVPPLMTANIADEVHSQWLSKLKPIKTTEQNGKENDQTTGAGSPAERADAG